MLTREPTFASALTPELSEQMALIDSHAAGCRKCTVLRGAHRHAERYVASLYGR